MSPQFALALYKRGIDPAGPAPAHAHRPAEHGSRCAVQRIRPDVQDFTSAALRARQAKPARLTLWQRLVRWVRGDA